MKQAQRSTQSGTSIWTHVCSAMINATLGIRLKKRCGQLGVLEVTELLVVSIQFSCDSSPLARKICCCCHQCANSLIPGA